MNDSQPVVIDRLWGPDLTDNFVEVMGHLSRVGVPADKLGDTYRRMLRGGVHTFVAKIGARIVATASYYVEQKFIHLEEKDNKVVGGLVGHVEDVVVHPDFRGQGLGRKLVAHLVECCRQDRCYKIVLSCSGKNVAYYEGCGFARHEYQMRMNLDGTPLPANAPSKHELDIEVEAEAGWVSLKFFQAIRGFSLDTANMDQLVETLQAKSQEAKDLFIDIYFDDRPTRGDMSDLKVLGQLFAERGHAATQAELYLDRLNKLRPNLLRPDIGQELLAAWNNPAPPSERIVKFWAWVDGSPN